MAKIIQLRDRKNKVYPKIKREIATAIVQNRYDQYQTAAWTSVNVKLNKIRSTTSKLTLEQNKIKIGKGIKKIIVSGQIAFYQDVHPPKYLLECLLLKNGHLITFNTFAYYGSTVTQVSCVVPATIIDVVEGDLIELASNYGSGLTPFKILELGTYLTVEVIE